MAQLVEIKKLPNKHIAAHGPAYFALESDRAIITAGIPAIYRVRIHALPADGDYILIGDQRFEFYNTAHPNFNPFSGFITRTGGGATVAQEADYFAQTINLNNNTNGDFTAVAVLDTFQYVEITTVAYANLSGGVRCFAANGTEYTSPGVDPITAAQTQTGIAADIRENYSMYAQVLCEQEYREGALAYLPRILQPVQAQTPTEFVFEIQRKIAAQLGYDLPAYGSEKLQNAAYAFRKCEIEFGDLHGSNQQANRNIKTGLGVDDPNVWLSDTNYEFYALNAYQDRYASLIDASLNFPDLLQPFFNWVGSGDPIHFLTNNKRKRTYQNAAEYLAFYADPDTSHFDTPLNLSLVVTIDGTDYISDFDFSDQQNAVPASTFNEHVWVMPLASIWNELSSQLAAASCFCVRIMRLNLDTGSNLITDGDNGTYNSSIAGVSATGGLPLSLNNLVFKAGGGSLQCGAQSYGVPTTISVQHATTHVLSPNTRYRMEWWVRVEQASTSGNLKLSTGLGDATIYASKTNDCADLTTTTAGQFVRYYAEFKTGNDVNFQFKLQSEIAAEGDVEFYLDEVVLIETDNPFDLTESIEYCIGREVCDFETFVYRNWLGMPETFHTRDNLTRTSEVERSAAMKTLSKRLTQNDREMSNPANIVQEIYAAVTERMRPYQVQQFREFLSSTEVHWDKSSIQHAASCAGTDTETSGWMPVVVGTEQLTYQSAAGDYQAFAFEFAEARMANIKD